MTAVQRDLLSSHSWDLTEALKTVPLSPGHHVLRWRRCWAILRSRGGAGAGLPSLLTSPCATARCSEPQLPSSCFGELLPSQACPKGGSGLSLELLSLAVVPAPGGWREREAGCAGAAC